MKIHSALNSAMAGIQKGITGLQRNAATIASAQSVNSADPAAHVQPKVAVWQPLVELQQQRLQVEASAQALAITHETLGTLIDIKV